MARLGKGDGRAPVARPPGAQSARSRAGSPCGLHAVRTPSARAAASLLPMAGAVQHSSPSGRGLSAISPGISGRVPGMPSDVPSDGRAPCPV